MVGGLTQLLYPQAHTVLHIVAPIQGNIIRNNHVSTYMCVCVCVCVTGLSQQKQSSKKYSLLLTQHVAGIYSGPDGPAQATC